MTSKAGPRPEVCDKCLFPRNGITHLASIAGEAACDKPVFRPLRDGEVSRELTLGQKTWIAAALVGGAALMIWLGTL